ncbi:MAG TPA: helix-turn-helix domain-containing protein [Pseudonocardiaceae bacterium]|nr:helix-turn-helix domain-containing protein [Pseudonocardiaceae bacterium]
MPTDESVSIDASETQAEKPLRADARRNRARVLDVAQEMFIAKGMAVPIDAIAERAGVGVGTVYRHFPTKEALFQAIMTRRIEQVVAKARARADTPDAGAAFFGFFTEMVEQIESSKGLHDALTEAGIKLDAAIGDLGQQLMVALDVLLDRAKRAGAVRTDISVVEVKALMTGLSLMIKQGGDPRLTLDVVLAGLRPQPAPAG